MDPKEQARQDVQAFLDQNKSWLAGFTVDFIVRNVQIFVPHAASLLSASDLRLMVTVWNSLNSPFFSSPTPATPSPPPLPASADNKLIETVKKAITTVTDGAPIITYKDGKANLSVGGLTADLTKGDAKLTAGVSWGGTLKVEAEKGDFKFSGTLSSDSWKIQLSFAEGSSLPDLTKLGDVFTKGEAALQKIIGATTSFNNLNDVARIKAAIAPEIKPVSAAVDAVQKIAKPPTKKVSFGLSVGSPDPGPGQSGIPRGVQVQATLTLRF